MLKGEREAIERAVRTAGKAGNLPEPYVIKAVYEDAEDKLIKFAVFTTGDGKIYQTGRFRLQVK